MASGVRVLIARMLISVFLWLLALHSSKRSVVTAKHQDHPKFWIANDSFIRDGKPFQIIGGDLHYFRVVPQYWEDRILRLKALGLNVIQTYVPWNLHEPKPGLWNFDGIADVEAFLKLAHKLDVLVMLRVGPYICAEWDLGGFPAWLLAKKPVITLRSSDPSYLTLVERWWKVLFAKMVPLLYSNGGPIIMVQIENEYGSYGKDKNYLQYLVKIARSNLGKDVILYTTDGAAVENLDNGAIVDDYVYAAVDFSTGDDPWKQFDLQKKYNAPGMSPALTAEFYTGWLTHWGESLAQTDAAFVASELDRILSRNGSAVLYMAHGGTNFGFFSGANTGEGGSSAFQPDTTSYDYDAPIREDGDTSNPKFKELQDIIRKYNPKAVSVIPPTNLKMYGTVLLAKVASVFEDLKILSTNPEGVYAKKPLTMESLDQNFGFMLYESRICVGDHGSRLSIPMIHDRAQVFIGCDTENNDGAPFYIGAIERWSKSWLMIPQRETVACSQLLILVENMGHVNYGQFIYDPKGILSPVLLDGIPIYGWRMYPLPLTNINELKKRNAASRPRQMKSEINCPLRYKRETIIQNSIVPTFYAGHFNISSSEDVSDTYISLKAWTKGLVFVNGFNVGRYWPLKGPQCNLYIPAPLLHTGENDLIIFELEKPRANFEVELADGPDFTCGQK